MALCKTNNILYIGPQLEIPLNPDRAVIAFDLHRVILHRSWSKVVTHGIRLIGCKKEILLFLLNPIFWIRALYARFKTGVSDDIYDRLVQAYPRLARFKSDFVDLENLQAADPCMIKLIQDLKKRGFVVILLSNIGERAYIDIKVKQPSVFSLFDQNFFPKKEDYYLQKPWPAFYKKFLTFLAHQGYKDKQVLFIDDNKNNVKAAAQAGISSIRFKSTKRLQAILKSLL